ncbi:MULTISPECIES: type II toxin-antitoxin system RelE/ParE family toxin [unclassified Pseudoalteromonas]|uniref:type II toxin-antitoxin system RelE/ParE family toxin n=1 Tax=unclassified Pseudoalteromonas TaxID=194690 RepID=UPI0018CD0426|nr:MULTISPECIES: type II toxin-antitoxin system RelE/ParE family toxin [unclassified Pseudoalteromonas]MBH0029620.1 type II toxin-antitoxin system RelE/ParE family toxin [Pseudoalteromonas sp. SWYJZ98]MDC9566563.1 type II toxin-antitoxin system RelE/ParE family toxin [Pseudoalteromonas sp. GAB2316C]MDC9570826.1 type II toxin-antitoxin system RelE/ParE family toxin [Pseudoalteromonas sp. GABNB9D]MDC9574856.1 type II toxin-antitoxin system RelE/ParE family toxin [Pseudoalteromonas sp. GABNS16A]M|tara:strand:+ start:3964 stop:4254 length:291 start_codon:yes stop_codon:yes gene_type:complete
MKFHISKKAKSDLIKIARYTQLNWGRQQRNDNLKLLDSVFHQIVEEPELGYICDYIREGYRKRPQGSHVIYYKAFDKIQVVIIRVIHKSMDVHRAL